MDSNELERRVEELFEHAIILPPAERVTFLDEACRNDPPEARRRVERLLAPNDELPHNSLDDEGFSRGNAMRIDCPHCLNPIQVVTDDDADEVVCPSCGSSFHVSPQKTRTLDRDRVPRIGRFESMSEIGRGAFGKVFKAFDTELKRSVAIKIPRRGALTDREEEDRFFREARSAAQLHHPGIVPVFEVGRTEHFPYIVSEFVEGITLADALSGRRFSFREAAALVRLLAEALDYSHRQGVVHRDLKPSNLMLDTRDSPRIMDFGLAKRETGEITMTVEGQVLGTPAYMSPEQAAGEGHQVDGRSDVYSLGVILYELLTGELPFRGNQRMLLHQVLHDEPRAPRSLNDRVPRDLETICLTAMAKESKRRFQTAAEFAEDLERYLNDEPILARPFGRLERGWRWCKRQPLAASLLATILLTLAGGAGISSYFAWNESVQSGRAQGLADERGRLLNEKIALASELEGALAKQELQLSQLFFERGWTKYFQGDSAAGLHDLLESVRVIDRLRSPSVLELNPELSQWNKLVHTHLIELALADSSARAVIRHDRGVSQVAFNRDGTRLATASVDGTARLWDVATGNPVGEPLRHESIVSHVAFSPDGARLVTLSLDKKVRLWDVATGNPLGEPLKQEDVIIHCAFSPDGTRLATASIDGTAWLWDMATGKPLGEPQKHERVVNHVAFSPDGSRLATASWDDTARLWDVATGKPLGEPMRHEGDVYHVAFSPDGSRLATASMDSTARLWDATTGKPLGEPLRHEDDVNYVAFSPDGSRLATASMDSTARLWDVATGKPLCESLRHEGAVGHVEFSLDGLRLATASLDSTARLWDVATGKPLGEPLRHEDDVNYVAFSPDGSRLATASTDSTARLWDLATGNPLGEPLKQEDVIIHCAFSPDGSRLATASIDGTAWLWDVATEKPVGEPLHHEDAVFHCAFSPNGARLATASWDDTARLWDVATAKPLGEPMRHKGAVDHVAFSPDGSRLATASMDSTARLWDATTGKPLGEPLRHEDDVNYVAFSPDGSRLATASRDSTARLWDVVTGKPLGEPMRHDDEVYHVVFSPDGSRLATASRDSTARLWDVATGKPLGEPMRHEGDVYHVAFSPDGSRLATASLDSTARLWDVVTGKPLGEVMRHDDEVYHVAFSPDGLRLATASLDSTARLWDVVTGKPLGEPMRHKGDVYHVAFSPDGARLATTSLDGNLRLWDICQPPNEPIELLERWVQVLTAAELDDRRNLIPLSADSLATKRDELQRLGGPPKEYTRILERRRRIWEKPPATSQ